MPHFRADRQLPPEPGRSKHCCTQNAPCSDKDRELTTLILDVGGVVVPTFFEIVDDPSFPAGPFGDDPLYRAVESGRMQERAYWADVARNRPDLDLRHLIRTKLHVRAEIRLLLDQIVGRFKVAALSNDMSYWFGPAWPLEFSELGAFDLLLDAGQFGHLKPDPSAFRWALSRVGEPPGNCLFVDDLAGNLVGARAVGMKVEQFFVTDPGGSVASILRRFERDA